MLYRLRFRDWGLLVHDLDVSQRHAIKIVNQRGLPVLGARVEVFDSTGDRLYQVTTGADGTAYFFPGESASPQSTTFEVIASKDEAEVSISFSSEPRQHTLTLDTRSSSEPIRLDVHFLIDSTGSMSDEIQQLKDNMISVAERIALMQSHPDVRYGMTIYRDRGDLFVSRTFDFTPDVAAFTEALREVQAEGGGDYPESLNESLHQAIHLPEWRPEETVSLLFLIADAPPHLDYAQDFDYAQDVFSAAESGIKIFPLASSGLDDQGEYIFRQLAQITGGKFLFLTYGPGGAPGEDTTHHVEDYSVLSLDDLVVRLVEEQLTYLNSPSQ
ncbi:MAG: VWA domain-containing protein [Anaerolineales bacterium]|nr:MAG: VWA domain-containing protein [Anaerolineales bacterium]